MRWACSTTANGQVLIPTPPFSAVYATKNLATAEGGMVLTNDETLMERIRLMSLHGMDRDAWKRYSYGGIRDTMSHSPGYKYNMPDLCAALGLSQLKKLPMMQESREKIAARYMQALKQIPGIETVGLTVRGRDKHALCMFPVRVAAQEAGIGRDALIEELHGLHIGTSVHYIPNHLFAAFRDTVHAPLPVTAEIWEQLISLPLYPTCLTKMLTT